MLVAAARPNPPLGDLGERVCLGPSAGATRGTEERAFPLGSGPRYMICVTLFCTLRESENTRTCENCTRNTRACENCTRNASDSRISVCFLTRTLRKNVRQNLIPWPLPIWPTYASEPQRRVRDFCVSLLDLSELRQALNFPSRAGNL